MRMVWAREPKPLHDSRKAAGESGIYRLSGAGRRQRAHHRRLCRFSTKPYSAPDEGVLKQMRPSFVGDDRRNDGTLFFSALVFSWFTPLTRIVFAR
jgi:hypothetical protein